MSGCPIDISGDTIPFPNFVGNSNSDKFFFLKIQNWSGTTCANWAKRVVLKL